MSIAASTLMIVSGLSGSGKSVALKTFEDLDYYCSDNLPVELLPDFVRSRLRGNPLGDQRLAVGIDVRSRSDLTQLRSGGRPRRNTASRHACCFSKPATKPCSSAMPIPAAAIRSASSAWRCRKRSPASAN